MSTCRAMKFKVGSPAQSESLQKALQALGYDHAHPAYKGKCVFTSRKDIFTDSEGVITSSITEECYDNEEGEEMDTAEFLVKHPEFPWFENTGEMPDLPAGTVVDIEFIDGCVPGAAEFQDWCWDKGIGTGEIAKWRYNRPSKASEYFVQPKTEAKLDAQGQPRLDCATYDDEGNMLSLKVGSLISINGNALGHLTTGTIDIGDRVNDWSVDAVGNVDKPVKSDGLATSYYDLVIRTKAGTFNCKVGDVIDAMVGNDFDLGNAIKAIRRIYEHVQGRGKDGIDAEYDKNKVNYFVNEFIERSKLK